MLAFYCNFFKGHKVSERSSWDLIAVLDAVRGISDYFTTVSEGKCIGQEDGSNQWIPGRPSNHSYLVYKMPQAELAAVIEDLLLTPRIQRVQFAARDEEQLMGCEGLGESYLAFLP